MAYSYFPPTGGVFAQARSEVRFLLQDTAPAAPDSLQDEELDYLLVQTSQDRRKAAARAARRMALVYSRKSGVSSKSVNGLSLSYNYADLAQTYLALAEDLENDVEGGGLAFAPVWTGSDDRADPFDEGMFDNTGGL